jgi:hypothetical protein
MPPAAREKLFGKSFSLDPLQKLSKGRLGGCSQEASERRYVSQFRAVHEKAAPERDAAF